MRKVQCKQIMEIHFGLDKQTKNAAFELRVEGVQSHEL